jgi:hypothetical protein
MMINKPGVFLVCLGLIFISCVEHEVIFKAQSEVDTDGTLYRQGEMKITISGDRNIDEDSLNIRQFYNENYVLPDESMYYVTRVYGDSLMTITWEGKIVPGADSIRDYIHKSKEGPTAVNNISVITNNRWIYRDIIYVETFSDPVDTARYFPLIKTRLSGASEFILSHEAIKGIRNKERAEDLLDRMETEAGLDLFRGILADPDSFDSLSAIYDDRIAFFADSLSGFAGVKQNPDSLGNLIHNVFDAAWDTLLSDHPGLFGSFSIDDSDLHNFRIEVSMPGCVINTNSDTTVNEISVWEFDRMDFFAREFTIEIAARQWRWLNIAITLLLIAAVLFVVFRPIRRGETG